MARPANPTPRWDGKEWIVRVTANGVQERHALPGIPENEPKLAAQVAKDFSDRLRAGDGVAADGSETCTAYRVRLDAHRKELGRRGGRFDESTWRVWIAPTLGPLAIAKVTRDDIERMRDKLDEQIALHTRTEGKEGIGAKRARNVWTCVTTTFKATTNAKRRDLRVRNDNPCSNVLPPERGESRRRPFVYPVELSAVLACVDVPQDVRELYAVATYLYLRPGELRALLVSDVDFAAGVVHVTKAYDEETKQTKAPKTRNGVRDVPIPATLVPLLQRLANGRQPGDPLLPVMARRSAWERARSFRAHLVKAKVTRPRLTADNPREEPVDFRSLRDSGITWLALSGVDVAKIQRRCGHDDIATSLGYVKLAEDIAGHVGEPFPPLPEELVGAFQSESASFSQKPLDYAGKQWPLRDLKAPAKRRESSPENARSASPQADPEVVNVASPTTFQTEKRPSGLILPASDPTSDSDLERAIVNAVMRGLDDVARVLAAQLQERQRSRVGANVVPLRR